MVQTVDKAKALIVEYCTTVKYLPCQCYTMNVGFSREHIGK